MDDQLRALQRRAQIDPDARADYAIMGRRLGGFECAACDWPMLPACGCGDQGSPAHACPFALDFHGVEEMCHCCESCEYECEMDI